MTSAAMLNRIPAEVNAPNPMRQYLMATALPPNRVQMKTTSNEDLIVISLLFTTHSKSDEFYG
jgi:hypothetical protein